MDLALGADALDSPRNWLYRWNFVRNLKDRYRRKAALFPERYSLDGLDRVRTIREFDDFITAPHCGYRDADDYYFRASALRVVERIRVPTLILIAQDDPIVPFAPFRDPAINGNPHVTVVAPEAGGHCGFVSRHSGDERFWAEARIVEFCRSKSALMS
jgi:hypothetical protein